MKVEVVTIGTELLLGHTVDTNGAELGRALAAVGVEVVRRTSVADDRDAVRSAVDDALGRTGFVVTTGGLGPTDDDLTRETVAALFGRRLVADPAVLRDIEARFRAIGRPMPAANRRQADIPEGATVLPNPRGTAPGLWVEDGGRTVVMLPGVPVELRGLLAGEVLPRLAPRGAGRVVLSRTVRTTGVAESALAERLGALAASLAPLSLAWLPSPEGVDLRLTAWALAPDDAATRLTAAASRVADAVGPDAYGEEAVDLAAVVLDALRRHAWRVAVAESCTGGLLGARLTAVPGASDVFLGGVIAYGDDAKRQRLGVAAALLERHGAVSGEVVGAMVDGVRGAFAAECGIAITGIAGPGGGSPEKPVGTVWIAVGTPADRRVLRRRFPGDREEVRRRSVQAALDLLRRTVQDT